MQWWCCCLHADRGSRCGRCRRRVAGGGDGVSGRGQVEQGADGPGHLGEPSLLQDVQWKTQLTLWNTDPATCLQEVLNVSSTFGHGEFRHSGGGDVDAGDGPRSHVIGQVTEHHPVCQSCSKVARQRHLQTGLNILSELLHQLSIFSGQRRSSRSLFLGLRRRSITFPLLLPLT